MTSMRVTIEPVVGGETPTALYHLYGADDSVLYIGITSDPETRFFQHSKDKAWWPEVARHTVEWHSDRPSAAAAEAAAIRAELPVHNLNGVSPRQRSAGTGAPELPAWSSDELSAIAAQVAALLGRRDVSHAHARLRALNLLLRGRDELPHGGELVALATVCGMSGREGYNALSLERGGWPEGW